MPTRLKKQRRSADAIGNAIRVVQIATGKAQQDYKQQSQSASDA